MNYPGRIISVGGFSLLLLIFVATSALSQDTIEIDTNVVVVGVKVRTDNGIHYPDLSKDDFEVFDNKEKRELEFFAKENEPVSYGIVYDLHPTTSQEMKSVLGSLEEFTKSLRDKDEYFLVLFNEFGSLNLNFVPSADQVERHLSFGERNEPNSLYDALYLAGTKLDQRPLRRKTLIVISDGKDHQSHHSFSELRRLLQSFNVQVYGIILDEKDGWAFEDIYSPAETGGIEKSGLTSAAIASLSTSSGGTTEKAGARSRLLLNGIFDRILDEMGEMYTLGFYPVDSKKHELVIKLKKTEQSGLKLSYRKKFQVEDKKQ